MGRRAVAVAATVLVAGALGGCSGEEKKPAPSMADVAGAVEGASLLHWTGSWKVEKQSMTLDLRTMGNGDAIGTVANGGDPADVLVVGSRVLLKGGRAYYRHGGVSSADAKRMAGHWVDDNGGVWGAALGGIAPLTLGRTLKERATSLAPLASWLPVGRSPSATPSSPRPTPSGVPSGALRFDVDTSSSPLGEGTYWVAAAAPHLLLGYSGNGMPGVLANFSGKMPVTLTAAPGSAAEATAAYTDLIAKVRTLPKAVPLDTGTTMDFDVDSVNLPEHCATRSCHIKVTGHNDATREQRTVQASVEVTLYGSRTMSGGEKLAGHCTAHMPSAAPGKTVHGACDVADSRIDKIWASVPGSFFKMAFWSERHQVTSVAEHLPLDPAALLARLASGAGH